VNCVRNPDGAEDEDEGYYSTHFRFAFALPPL